MLLLCFSCFQIISYCYLSCLFWWEVSACQQITLYRIWHWHQLEEWASARSGIYKSLLTFTWSSCYPRDKVHISGCCEIQCMCSRVTITLEHKERKDISPWQCGQGSLGGNLGRALCSAYWVKRRILAIEFHREARRDRNMWESASGDGPPVKQRFVFCKMW